jgi:hypothetical protein
MFVSPFVCHVSSYVIRMLFVLSLRSTWATLSIHNRLLCCIPEARVLYYDPVHWPQRIYYPRYEGLGLPIDILGPRMTRRSQRNG